MIEVEVLRAEDTGRIRCPRCWHWTFSANFDGLCNPCVAVILKDFPEHESVPGILDNLESRGLRPEDNPASHE